MQNKEIEMDKTHGLDKESSFYFHGYDPEELHIKVKNWFRTISAQQVSKMSII